MGNSDVDVGSVHYHPTFAAESNSVNRDISDKPSLGLYLHIPFCATRCHFCTFAIVTGKTVKDDLVERYLIALKREIEHFAKRGIDRRPAVKTIQIGGGTPTMLSAAQLDDLLNFVLQTVDTSDLREIVIEGFPTTITAEKMDVFAKHEKLKFNIGIQTFNDQNLDDAGRRHSLEDAIKAVRTAQSAGIRSVGVDIIFGLPFSEVNNVIRDLDTVAELGIDHLAFYPLWVYGDTAIGRKIRVGTLPPADYQNLQRQMSTGLGMLDSLGYERYTAFHYARSVDHRHQYGLWQMRAQEWIGFGMAAMSYLDGHIHLNEGKIHTYIDKIQAGQMNTGTSQFLSEEAEMRFAFLYGLRLRNYPFSLLREKFNRNPDEVFGVELEELRGRGLIEIKDENISLTPEGILGLGKIEERINLRATMDA